MSELPDVETATYEQLDRALDLVARAHRMAAHEVVTRGLPESVAPDVAAWWAAAWTKRLTLIASTPPGPLYVTDAVEPMERRKDRLRKPGPAERLAEVGQERRRYGDRRR